MHLRQLGGKRRLVVDEYGLEVSVAEPDHNGEHPTVLRLGQRFRADSVALTCGREASTFHPSDIVVKTACLY